MRARPSSSTWPRAPRGPRPRTCGRSRPSSTTFPVAPPATAGPLPCSAEVDVQPDHGPAGEGPQLDQVAELVDHPQPAPAVAVERRALPADHGVLDPAGVADLAHQGPSSRQIRREPRPPPWRRLLVAAAFG